MSRDADNTPIPMSPQRRDGIVEEVRAAMEWCAPMQGEAFTVVIVRRDGSFMELVMCEDIKG